jgi:hypothetical protein
MGREIRRVPPNWEHPKKEVFDPLVRAMTKRYQPLFDRPFAPAMREWIADWEAWEAGTHEDFAAHSKDCPNYWDWSSGPPDPHYYRPNWKEGEATWWQVYETVSEGTPVSPPFATPDELVNYLATHGDFWDQKRGDGPWDRRNAETFVKAGWAPSMTIMNGELRMARDGMPT